MSRSTVENQEKYCLQNNRNRELEQDEEVKRGDLRLSPVILISTSLFVPTCFLLHNLPTINLSPGPCWCFAKKNWVKDSARNTADKKERNIVQPQWMKYIWMPPVSLILASPFDNIMFLLHNLLWIKVSILFLVQSGASSPAKHGDAYFSSVYGSIQDPIAAPGTYENQEP